MTTPTLKLYRSAPIEKHDSEQRLEKKLKLLTVLVTQLLTLGKWLFTSKTKTINQKRDIKIIKLYTLY